MRRLRIATYNVHQCVGADGRRLPERVAAVLREIDADVVGLQEVDARPGGGHDSMQMDYLASQLELEAFAGPTILRHDGHYGNALLTRRPVLDLRHVDLTVYRREPRAAIDVRLDVGGRTVRLVATHLGLLPGERRKQVRRLLDLLGQEAGVPTILCGDINEWFGVGRPLRWLNRRLGPCSRLTTFPAAFPIFALDRVWSTPPARLVRVAAHVSETARVASDHLPLVADVELPD
jgi:endonuclease/exonuclease/phosphatase family metal-dependent hydrolase